MTEIHTFIQILRSRYDEYGNDTACLRPGNISNGIEACRLIIIGGMSASRDPLCGTFAQLIPENIFQQGVRPRPDVGISGRGKWCQEARAMENALPISLSTDQPAGS